MKFKKELSKLTLAMLSTIILTSGVYASDNNLQIMPISADTPTLISVDKPVLINAPVNYVPLREVFEEASYKVDWVNETRTIEISLDDTKIATISTKDNTILVEKDMILPVDMKIENDKSYINLTGLTDYFPKLEKDYSDKLTASLKEYPGVKGIVKKVTLVDDNLYILVEGIALGKGNLEQIVLKTNDNTTILGVDKNDIKEGMILTGTYDFRTTRSMPAQSSANLIVFDEQKAANNFEATIEKITMNESTKSKQILINKIFYTETLRAEQLILNITDETSIKDFQGNELNFSDLKKDMTINLTHDLRVTRSFPGISNALELTVLHN